MEIIGKVVLAVGRRTSSTHGTLLGTCFALNKPGYFATCHHVADGNPDGLCLVEPHNNSIDSYQTQTETGIWNSASIVAVDPIRDICIFKTDGDLKNPLPIRGADLVTTLQKVFIFGYPHLATGRTILTGHEPMVGAKIRVDRYGNDVKYLVLNMLTGIGQSGSPIFLNQGSGGGIAVVGMLTGAYKYGDAKVLTGDIDISAVNQTSYAVSTEYIESMY